MFSKLTRVSLSLFLCLALLLVPFQGVVFAAATTAPSASDITVTNNYVGTSDTVVVSNLTGAGDIKVYAAAKGGTAIVTGKQR